MKTPERTFYIYCHTAPNGKMYVGQTSLDPEKRWAGGRGYAKCTYIYRAIKKYGWDNFRHDIICVVHSRELANLFEQYYIAKYKTFSEEYGYNLTMGGSGVVGCKWDEERKKARSESIRGENNGMYGRHHSDASRRKMSEKLSGRELSPEMKKLRASYLLKSIENSKLSVRQIDSEGNIVATYCSIAEAASKTGTNRTGIVNCVRGKAHTAGGFKWEYTDNQLRKESQERFQKRNAALREKSLKGGGTLGMAVVQFDLDGNEIARFKSLSDAERKTGLHRDRIGDCCHDGMGCFGGYKWDFADKRQLGADGVKVRQIGLDGAEIAVFDNIASASRATGARRYGIRNCCRGVYKTSHGFKWEFVNGSSEKRKSKPYTGVVQLNADGNEVARYTSIAEAMRVTGHDKHRIVECCKGERDSYKGTRWQYAEIS